jgi:hypothetical protein
MDLLDTKRRISTAVRVIDDSIKRLVDPLPEYNSRGSPGNTVSISIHLKLKFLFISNT